MYISQYMKSDNYAVGLDISMTSSGVYFAAMHPDLADYSYEVGSDSKSGRDLQRQFGVVDTILEDLEHMRGRVSIVTIEHYGPINNRSGKIAQRAEICGVLKNFILRDLRCQLALVSPKPLKKFATGNGNASKQAMMAAAATLYRFIASTDNEADACHAAHFGYRVLAGLKTSVDFELYKPD